MAKIKFTIDGQKLQANEGESILNIARANNIFIPAICYLNGCSPALACRLCMVEADGKNVFSCNAKAKDGMQVITESDELDTHRTKTMEVYDVNHPLECGVCDKSGECELQNYTHLTEVNEQTNTIADAHRPQEVFNDDIIYNPGLCIMCERCITVCKDSVGEGALGTRKRGGETLDKGLKESLSKDLFAMWNKMQKSLIAPKEGDGLDCSSCGECISVCPVGSLTSSNFEYTSNSWELNKIPASNPHSSDCELLYYEVKHDSHTSNEPKIYRVTNDFGFSVLHGAARFGFDYIQKAIKNEDDMKRTLLAFKKADTIIFDSFITNEEALILQKLKEKYNYKLINHEAKAYQDFLYDFGHIYSGALDDVKSSDLIITMGTNLSHDHPNTSYAMNKAIKMNKAKALYFHPIGNNIISSYAKEKSLLCVAHEILDEVNILEMISNKLTSLEIQTDFSFLEELQSKVDKFCEIEGKVTLIIGEDFYTHPNSAYLANLLHKIQSNHASINIVLIPPRTNSLGVALICDLDIEAGEYSMGYNQKADFTLSALGAGDMHIPTLAQQEGTFTNIDKKVVPTNVALPHNGYNLNDIANHMGLNTKNTIDYTVELPIHKGYKSIAFDDLDNYYSNDNIQHRGYDLEDSVCFLSCNATKKETKKEKSQYVYRCNPIKQFNYLTAKSKNIKEKSGLYASVAYIETLELSDGAEINITINDIQVKTKIYIDNKITGDIVYITDFDDSLPTSEIFENQYRFQPIQIKKV